MTVNNEFRLVVVPWIRYTACGPVDGPLGHIDNREEHVLPLLLPATPLPPEIRDCLRPGPLNYPEFECLTNPETFKELRVGTPAHQNFSALISRIFFCVVPQSCMYFSVNSPKSAITNIQNLNVLQILRHLRTVRLGTLALCGLHHRTPPPLIPECLWVSKAIFINKIIMSPVLKSLASALPGADARFDAHKGCFAAP